ncbi:MAG: helix-turn-helix domain-containing protein [Solirubrobacteraceae bacterium]
MAAFGAKLRRLRKEAGLTQEQLGARCGMDLAAVSRLERGLKDARLSTIVRLAHALDVTPASLIEDVR